MGTAGKFGIVGTGWRSRFYLKLASLLPDQFEVVGVVGRNPERAEQAAGKWGVPVYGSLCELVAAGSRTSSSAPCRGR